MGSEITLVDLLPEFAAEDFAEKYPGRRRKLRFNTSWTDVKTKIFRDFYSMYRDNDKSFIPYILSVGSDNKKRLSKIDIVFQFIEVKPHKWLFVGAYEVIDLTKFEYDDVIGMQFKYANAKRLVEFDKFSDRLIVEHINKPQQFYYTNPDIIDNVKVSEVLSRPYLAMDEEFPGYNNVCKDYKSLSHCMGKSNWRDALNNVYGVYVLTDTKTGKQYVGSATGVGGIWGRWHTYLDKGYDDSNKEYPNKKLKDLVKEKGIKYIKDNFQYSILEIFPKTDIGRDKALVRESFWKNVLRTREFGYNDN